MRVICRVNTTKLVKGSIYEVARLQNSKSRSRIFIKGMGNYVVKNFTQMDGTPIPQIDWEDPSLKPNENIYIKNPEELKKGDILSCKWGSKYLNAGDKYRVSEVLTTEVKSFSSRYTVTKIKVEGLNRWLNTYRFQLLTKEESRDLSLNEIFDISEKLSVDTKIRKIDNMDELKKRKIILSVIFNSILDIYRNNLSIIDWAVQKTGKKWDLNSNDLKPYLNLTLEEIIQKME